MQSIGTLMQNELKRMAENHWNLKERMEATLPKKELRRIKDECLANEGVKHATYYKVLRGASRNEKVVMALAKAMQLTEGQIKDSSYIFAYSLPVPPAIKKLILPIG